MQPTNPVPLAQSASEALMFSEGRIYVVVGVIAILLVGLFIWLTTMESRLRRLESEE